MDLAARPIFLINAVALFAFPIVGTLKHGEMRRRFSRFLLRRSAVVAAAETVETAMGLPLIVAQNQRLHFDQLQLAWHCGE